MSAAAKVLIDVEGGRSVDPEPSGSPHIQRVWPRSWTNLNNSWSSHMTLLRAFALSVAPLGLVAVALPAPAIAQGQAGLAEVQAHLRAVSSMTANFAQTDRRGRTLNGNLALKRPGKIRFQYNGVKMLVVADGSR
jgi:hypothetical protein